MPRGQLKHGKIVEIKQHPNGYIRSAKILLSNGKAIREIERPLNLSKIPRKTNKNSMWTDLDLWANWMSVLLGVIYESPLFKSKLHHILQIPCYIFLSILYFLLHIVKLGWCLVTVIFKFLSLVIKTIRSGQILHKSMCQKQKSTSLSFFLNPNSIN